MEIKGTLIPEMYSCIVIDDVTFSFNKSYLRPARAQILEEEIRDMRKEAPSGSQMHIFGHTDNVGSVTYNKDLSERRAKSIYYFLTHDSRGWVDLHLHEAWGSLEVQETINALKQPGAGGCQAKSALPMEAYLGQFGRRANQANLERLYLDYMKHFITKPFDAFLDFCGSQPYDGCSEFNPLLMASLSRDNLTRDQENEPNRRVAIFMFEQHAKFPCQLQNLSPCYRYKYSPPTKGKALFECEFYANMIDSGECTPEKKIKQPPSPPLPSPSQNISIKVTLGFRETVVDPWIIRQHKADPVLFTKWLEGPEVNCGGSVVAVLPEEIMSLEIENKDKGIKNYRVEPPLCFVKSKAWFSKDRYFLKAEVVYRETQEKLFEAQVDAPRLIGIEGYWEKTGPYVWRHVRKGRALKPGYETQYMEGLGLDNFISDLTLLLRIETGPRWKEYRNITERVNSFLQSRGFSISTK